MNKTSLEFFTAMASSKSVNEESVKINSWNNHAEEDAEFVLSYAKNESTLLDIASGTGLLINKLYPYLRHITAVELFPEFTQFIVKSENVTIIHEDIMTFSTREQFDLITLFGIMHYFSREEATLIYSHYYHNLKKGGYMLIKQQFGVYEDVRVQTPLHSVPEHDYHSEYRYIESELELLSSIGYSKVEYVDIYPPEYNKWDNTHYYAIIAQI